MKIIDKYISDIESGAILSCSHVKNAINIFKKDLQRTDLEFSESKVQQVLEFFSSLKHFEGRHSGNHFDLKPWQVFIIANIYGFYWAGSDLTQRRFQTA